MKMRIRPEACGVRPASEKKPLATLTLSDNYPAVIAQLPMSSALLRSPHAARRKPSCPLPFNS